MNTSKRKRRHPGVTLLTAVICGFAGEAFATCTTNSCTDTISLIYLTDNGVYVQLTSGLSGLTNCTPLSGIYLTVPKTDSNFSAYYATILSARITNQALTLRLTDNSTPCAVTYLTM